MLSHMLLRNIMKYSYIPICKSKISVCMKDGYEIHIILRTNLAYNSDLYEIIIRRETSAICEINKNTANVVTVDTKSMFDLMSDIICLQWYCDGMLIVSSVQIYGESFIIMSYKDKSPFIINYIGADINNVDFTFFGHQYDTKYIVQVMRQQLLDTCHYWLRPQDEEESYGLTKIVEGDGYIGRARLMSAVIPGIVIQQYCIISYHVVYHMENYEILYLPENKTVKWLAPQNGKIPLYALPAGEAENGETLFIGRAEHNSTNRVGNIRQLYNKCFISENNLEVPISQYQFLIVYDKEIDDDDT